MGYIVSLLLSASSPQMHHTMSTDVIPSAEGNIALTVVRAPQSRKAHNRWDRLSFAKDEGNDGTMPLINVTKGGL